MDAIQRFQIILILMQAAAFVLGMMLEHRLEKVRREHEHEER